MYIVLSKVLTIVQTLRLWALALEFGLYNHLEITNHSLKRQFFDKKNQPPDLKKPVPAICDLIASNICLEFIDTLDPKSMGKKIYLAQRTPSCPWLQ